MTATLLDNIGQLVTCDPSVGDGSPLGLLGDAQGAEADGLRNKLTTLQRKYERFANVFAEIIPVTEGPVDLEDLIDNIPSAMMGVFSSMARRALGLSPRADKKAAAARKS